MLRERLLGRRGLVWAVALWGIAWSALPHPAARAAVPWPPGPGGAGAADVGATEAGAAETGAADARARDGDDGLRERLRAAGLSPADADAVLARLSPEERAEMAARADELGAGGNPVIGILAVAVIVTAVVIFALELMGRRVVSRP